ncbi:unnamed protein product, partial [Litomosoides sigmodontis]
GSACSDCHVDVAVMGKRYFHAQNYRRLKAECIRRKQLFVDVQFPPTNDSLFLKPANPEIDIIWKRPGLACSSAYASAPRVLRRPFQGSHHELYRATSIIPEIVDNPQLFVEGAAPNDVTQGILGNCWFVSACSALTHNQTLLQKVVPDATEQEWTDSNKYCGIFRFRFWRFDKWIEVVIDDLLPTQDGKLLFARSKSSNEFWSALLEKAFAKLYGCYENLVGGQLSDALEEISGGIAETINVQKELLMSDRTDSSRKLFHAIKKAFDQRALIVAAIAAKSKDEIEVTLECGLVKGHAYAVTAVRFVELNAESRSFSFFTTQERQMMIRLQNPWGEKEWNGPWSDGSLEWERVTEAEKKELGITVEEDGEFWMPWNEFTRYFTDFGVCQIFNTSLFDIGPKFYEWKFFGEWKSNGARQGALNDRAGGCINFAATFCCNPQYRFDIDVNNSEVKFALTQQLKNEGEKNCEPLVTVGMHLMRVEDNRAINPEITSDYSCSRSVYLHCQNLQQGRYILLPTTFAPFEFAKFLLRIYSERNIVPRELKQDVPGRGLCFRRKQYTHTLLSVVIRKQYEQEQLKVPRKDTTQNFLIELVEDRAIHDRILGVAHVVGSVDNDTRSVQYNIVAGNHPIATLSLIIQSYDDPMYL